MAKLNSYSEKAVFIAVAALPIPIALVITLVLTWPLAASAVGGDPRPVLVDGQISFGQIEEGTVVERTFTIRNAGEKPFSITRIVTSCGCVAINESSEANGAPDVTVPSSPSNGSPIGPGEDRVLRVTFDSTGFAGPETKKIHIYTNVPAQRMLSASLVGTVVPLVEVSPAQVYWEEVVRDGREVLSSAEVTVQTQRARVLGDPLSSSSNVAVEVLARGPQKLTLRVSVLSSAPAGDLRERIIIPLSGVPGRPSITIPVAAQVLSVFSVVPRTASFGVVDRSAQSASIEQLSEVGVLVRQVKLVRKGGSAAVPVAVRGADSAVQAVLSPDTKAGVWILRLRLDPSQLSSASLSQGFFKSTITVELEGSSQRELVVPVMALVRP